MSKIMLIFNPVANHHQAAQVVSDLRSIIDELGGADWVGTEYPTHASKLAAEAALDDYDTVVAIGGDGTVHEVVNGLMHIAPEHRPRLGMIPVGAGNDFAMAAGVSANLEQAVRRVFGGQQRTVDVCSIKDGAGRLEYWNNTCGIGLDGKINIATRKIKRIHGFMMYFIGTLQTVIRDYESSNMKIWVDDQPMIEHKVLMLTLGNGPREGGGFQTTPDSKIDDGLLEFMRLNHVNRPTIMMLIPRVMNGTHVTSKHVTMGEFRRLRLEADRALPIHLDGELFAGYEANVRAVEIKIHPGAIQVLT